MTLLFQNSKLYKEFKSIIDVNKELHSEIKNSLNDIERTRQIKEMINKCILIYKSLLGTNYNKPILETSLNITLQKEIKEAMETSHFMPLSIKQEIHSLFDNGLRKKYFNIKCKNVSVECVILEHDTFLDKINSNKLAKFIEITVSLLMEYKIKKTSEKIVLFIAPTKYKKKFNKDYETPLTSTNANSGFTIRTKEKKTIVIYRSEELFKVTLHELIHSLELDMSELFSNHDERARKYHYKLIECVGKDYNNSQLLLGETYNDFYTILIYTVFYNIDTLNSQSSTLTFEKVFEKFIERYSEECMYGLLKTHSIISYYSSFYDFVNNKKIRIKPISLGTLFSCGKSNDFISELVKKKIGETTTSVIEYYIIKNVLMMNASHLLNLREHNTSLMDIENSSLQLSEILKTIYYFTASHKQQQNYDKLLNSLIIPKNETNVYETLCMSMFN